MILGTPTMEDAQRLRQVYLIAMAQHELDVLKLNIAEHIEGTRSQRKQTLKKTRMLDKIMDIKAQTVWHVRPIYG